MKEKESFIFMFVKRENNELIMDEGKGKGRQFSCIRKKLVSRAKFSLPPTRYMLHNKRP